MEKLAGKRQKYGEVSYEFEVFRDLKLCFILWSCDEEFPPSAQILFSDNFPMAFAAEDVAYLGDVILDYMKQEEFIIQKGGKARKYSICAALGNFVLIVS